MAHRELSTEQLEAVGAARAARTRLMVAREKVEQEIAAYRLQALAEHEDALDRAVLAASECGVQKSNIARHVFDRQNSMEVYARLSRAQQRESD